MVTSYRYFGNVEKSRQRRFRHFSCSCTGYAPCAKRAAALLDGLFGPFPLQHEHGVQTFENL